MAGLVIRELTEQRITQVRLRRLADTRWRNTRMGFVDDDQFWAMQGEFVTAGLLLDEVGRDYEVRVVLVNVGAEWDAARQPVYRRRKEQLCLDAKLVAQFALPLRG